jgi:hypothetical protein
MRHGTAAVVSAMFRVSRLSNARSGMGSFPVQQETESGRSPAVVGRSSARNGGAAIAQLAEQLAAALFRGTARLYFSAGALGLFWLFGGGHFASFLGRPTGLVYLAAAGDSQGIGRHVVSDR